MSQPLQIDYATQDADGLPVYHAEAEAIMDAGGDPSAIRKCFRKRHQASRYFAKSMARRFGPLTLAADCTACGRPADLAAFVNWTAQAKPGFISFSVQKEEGVAYGTTHAMCAACLEPWYRSSRRLRRVLVFLRFSSWSVLLIIAASYLLNRVGRSDWANWIWGTWLALAILGAIASRIMTWQYVRMTPRPIRMLIRRNVRCLGLDGIATREELEPAEPFAVPAPPPDRHAS